MKFRFCAALTCMALLLSGCSMQPGGSQEENTTETMIVYNSLPLPNLFVDITDTLEEKVEVMMIYDTEIEDMPFPRSLTNVRSLASVRGGCCVSRYAEAFCIVKQIE